MSIAMISHAFDQRGIGPALKLAYIHVCDALGPWDEQYAGIYLDELAEFVGVPESTARGLLDEMVWKGLIRSWSQPCDDSTQLEIWTDPLQKYPVSEGRPSLSTRKRKAVIERDGEICTYCGDEGGPFHIDHIFPVSRGGTNDMDNLTVACRTCNISKGDKLLSDWNGAKCKQD